MRKKFNLLFFISLLMVLMLNTNANAAKIVEPNKTYNIVLQVGYWRQLTRISCSLDLPHIPVSGTDVKWTLSGDSVKFTNKKKYAIEGVKPGTTKIKAEYTYKGTKYIYKYNVEVVRLNEFNKIKEYIIKNGKLNDNNNMAIYDIRYINGSKYISALIYNNRQNKIDMIISIDDDGITQYCKLKVGFDADVRVSGCDFWVKMESFQRIAKAFAYINPKTTTFKNIDYKMTYNNYPSSVQKSLDTIIKTIFEIGCRHWDYLLFDSGSSIEKLGFTLLK